MLTRVESVLETYRRLPEEPRKLLQGLVLAGDDLSRTALVRMLKQFEWMRAKGDKALSTQTIAPALQVLEDTGLVVKNDLSSGAVYRAHPAVIHPALEEAQRAGSLRALGSRIHTDDLSIRRYSLRSEEDTCRFRLTFYLRPQGKLPLWMLSRHSDVGDVLNRMLGSGAPAAFYLALDPDDLQTMAPMLLQHALGELQPISPGFLEMVASADLPLITTAMRRDAGLLAALQGQSNVVTAIAQGLGSADRALVLAIHSLVDGDIVEARRHTLEVARMAVAKKRGNVNVAPWKGVLGPLWTLLGATDPDSSMLETVRHQIAAGRKNKTYGERAAYCRLELFQEFSGGARLSQQRFDGGWSDGWVATLVGLRVGNWMGLHPNQFILARQAAFRRQAALGGYTWVYEVLRPPNAAGPTPRALEQFDKLHQRVPLWQRQLKALQEVAAGRANVDGLRQEPEERLVWHVKFRDEDPYVVARIQRRTRSGWSEGRELRSPEGVLQAARACGGLDASERGVLDHHGWVGDHFDGVEGFEAPALRLLVGHPRVVVGEDATTIVPVSAVTPRLMISRRKRGIGISLEPYALRFGEAWAEATPGGLAVYVLDASQARARDLLGPTGVEVPCSAEEELSAFLADFGRLFPLQSDLEVPEGAGERVEACARIHVQLSRVGGGLAYRVRSLPLGADGPDCFPGSGPEHLFGSRDHSSIQARRDLAAERRNYAALREACPGLDLPDSFEKDAFDDFPRDLLMQQEFPEGVVTDLEACLEMVSVLQALQDSVSIDWPKDTPLKILAPARFAALSVKISAPREDWFEVEGSVEVDEARTLSLMQLLKLRGSAVGRFITLEDGEILALSHDLKQKIDRLARLADVDTNTIRTHSLAASLIDEWCDGIGTVDRSDAVQRCVERAREAMALQPTVPNGFQGTLRPYQQEGFEWMMRLAHWGAGACLADDMGLGKTIQTLAVLDARRASGPALVLAPASVVSNWEKESTQFAPGLKVSRILRSADADEVSKAGPGMLFLASYGLLPRIVESLASLRWGTLVLDEAQAVKNSATRRARAVRQLSASFRIGLSGTPVENHLGELWSLFSFLNPGLLGSERDFLRRFAVTDVGAQAEAREILRERLRPFMLRRTKNRVLAELPEKTEIVLKVKLSKEERTFYEAVRRNAIEDTQNAGKQGGAHIRYLAALMRLRRAACHPRLVDSRGPEESAKLSMALELIDELREGEHRALVFSQFVDHLQIVRTKLDARGIAYQYLDGKTPQAKRRQAVDAFQAGEGDVFLISLKAGGLGLNLTAADYVIHLDPWWNPAAEDQASDRAHRMGQTRPVTVYRLVAEHTVEDRIVALHEEKRELAESLLSNSERPIALDEHTLRSLLEEEEEKGADDEPSELPHGAHLRLLPPVQPRQSLEG